MNSLLSLREVGVSHRERPLLEGVSFDVAGTGITALAGPSGTGKSTLLRALNRLLEEEEGFSQRGEIHFEGRNVAEWEAPQLRRRVALLFQRPVIFPISIRKNVLFGVRHLKVLPKEAWEPCLEGALRQAYLWDEVKDRLDDSALRLSVGQQQRLAIARTLALEPQALLLDEPTAALDVQATEKIEELVLSLRTRCPLLIVTHSPSQAKRLADQVVFLHPEGGVGRTAYVGPPAGIAACPTLPDYFRRAFDA